MANIRYKVGDTWYDVGSMGGSISEITVDSQLSDTSANPVENRVITKALEDSKEVSVSTATPTGDEILWINPDGTSGGGGSIDSELSTTSMNPVQNKVITTALSGKQSSLSTAQLAAANSGITAAKVSTYDGYSATLDEKANINSLNIFSKGNWFRDEVRLYSGNGLEVHGAEQSDVKATRIKNNQIVYIPDINASTSYAYSYPTKSGTIALTSDLTNVEKASKATASNTSNIDCYEAELASSNLESKVLTKTGLYIVKQYDTANKYYVTDFVFIDDLTIKYSIGASDAFIYDPSTKKIAAVSSSQTRQLSDICRINIQKGLVTIQ